MFIDNEYNELYGTNWGIWANAAVVSTEYQIQNNPEYDQVNNGNLHGFVWLFGHFQGTPPEAESADSILQQGAILDTIVGNSSLRAVFLSNTNGWFLSGTLQQSSIDNPTAAPITFSDWVFSNDIDEFHDCLQLVAVPSNLVLAAGVWDPGSGQDPLSGEQWDPDDLSLRVRGQSYVNIDAEVQLKAFAGFYVRNN
jgi:hypothetical protein